MDVKNMGLIDEMQELQRKAELYNVVKKNCDEATATLQEVKEKVDAILKILNPASTVGQKRSYHRLEGFDKKAFLEKYYNMMKMGLSVNLKMIEKDYPEIVDGYRKTLFYSDLQQMPQVKKHKIDNRLTLFMDKTV